MPALTYDQEQKDKDLHDRLKELNKGSSGGNGRR
jgi:hypothetical protein